MNQQPRGRSKIRGEKREFKRCRCGKMTGQEVFSFFIFFFNFQLLFSALDFWVRQQLKKDCCSFGEPGKLLLLDSGTTN